MGNSDAADVLFLRRSARVDGQNRSICACGIRQPEAARHRRLLHLLPRVLAGRSSGDHLPNKTAAVARIHSASQDTGKTISRGLSLASAQSRSLHEGTSDMSHDDHMSSVPVMSTGQGHINSGIVVFSSTRKTLYMNEAAQQLLMRLNRTESGHAAIPPSVDNLLDEILPLLRVRGTDRGWKQLVTRRLAMAPDRSVLVKTFGIPDRRDSHRSLIVFTIQETPAS